MDSLSRVHRMSLFLTDCQPEQRYSTYMRRWDKDSPYIQQVRDMCHRPGLGHNDRSQSRGVLDKLVSLIGSIYRQLPTPEEALTSICHEHQIDFR
jgi:hypothetical protein